MVHGLAPSDSMVTLRHSKDPSTLSSQVETHSYPMTGHTMLGDATPELFSFNPGQVEEVLIE